jgi:DNA-binding transcriptional ArsR family regulator
LWSALRGVRTAGSERPSDKLIATERPRLQFERLKSGPKPVGAIARGMPVSCPAVSQHLKVLKEAGLVADQADGTRRVYYIDLQGLGALRGWRDQFWDRALAAFQSEIERQANDEKRQKP